MPTSSVIAFGDQRLPARFWAKVEQVPLSTCWYWTGATAGAGYGVICWGPKVRGNTKTTYVHRLAYEKLVGPIPVGLELDHFACSVSFCCNPAHVRPVTHRENILRSNAPTSINAAKMHCRLGHELAMRMDGHRYCKRCDALRAAAKRRGA